MVEYQSHFTRWVKWGWENFNNLTKAELVLRSGFVFCFLIVVKPVFKEFCHIVFSPSYSLFHFLPFLETRWSYLGIVLTELGDLERREDSDFFLYLNTLFSEAVSRAPDGRDHWADLQFVSSVFAWHFGRRAHQSGTMGWGRRSQGLERELVYGIKHFKVIFVKWNMHVKVSFKSWGHIKKWLYWASQ